MPEARKPGCPFCGDISPGVVVYDDPLVYAIVSQRPINDYHVLVIPKHHYEQFIDLPDPLAAHLFVVAKHLSHAVRQVRPMDAICHLSDDDITGAGYNLVRHYKLHIIPRHVRDRVVINWNRDPDPGEAARSALAAEIRSALAKLGMPEGGLPAASGAEQRTTSTK